MHNDDIVAEIADPTHHLNWLAEAFFLSACESIE
jgi:hypothetical protein